MALQNVTGMLEQFVSATLVHNAMAIREYRRQTRPLVAQPLCTSPSMCFFNGLLLETQTSKRRQMCFITMELFPNST